MWERDEDVEERQWNITVSQPVRLYQSEEHNRFTLNQKKGQFKMWGKDEDAEERQRNLTDLHSVRRKDY